MSEQISLLLAVPRRSTSTTPLERLFALRSRWWHMYCVARSLYMATWIGAEDKTEARRTYKAAEAAEMAAWADVEAGEAAVRTHWAGAAKTKEDDDE